MRTLAFVPFPPEYTFNVKYFLFSILLRCQHWYIATKSVREWWPNTAHKPLGAGLLSNGAAARHRRRPASVSVTRMTLIIWDRTGLLPFNLSSTDPNLFYSNWNCNPTSVWTTFPWLNQIKLSHQFILLKPLECIMTSYYFIMKLICEKS
jgi:hypothetical protein